MAPEQTVVPTVVTTGVDRWVPLLKEHFGSQWRNALAVLKCESSGNPAAIGPTDSKGYNPIGLMQIKNFAGRPSTEALKNGETNMAYAAFMYRSQGWEPWECATKLGIR